MLPVSADGKSRADAISTFLLVMGYGLIFYCLQLFLFRMGFTGFMPNDVSLDQWDAVIYHRAAHEGYYYKTAGDTNGGIYILLPWVWHLLNAGVMGMCLANLVFFALGFTIITRIYPVPLNDQLLWLTTPSLYFMGVPYTEALFCLLIAMTFYGIAKRNKWLIITSLLLVSLCRATTIFMIPSLLVMELLTHSRRETGRVVGYYLVYYVLPMIVGLAVFVLVQYQATGIWFLYFKVQAKNLGHEWTMPVLPFCNYYGGERITWLSGLALLPCFVALLLLIKKIYKWLFKQKIYTDKIWILTLCYLPIIMFTMVFCNPKWGDNRTNLLGLHRYVFCSPFVFVLLYHLFGQPREYKARHFLIVFLVCNVVWLTMGSYWHLQNLLFYNFLSLLAMGYMVHANRKTQWVTLLLCGLNLLFQITLFQQYIAGQFTD